jgi:hypothetical protein
LLCLPVEIIGAVRAEVRLALYRFGHRFGLTGVYLLRLLRKLIVPWYCQRRPERLGRSNSYSFWHDVTVFLLRSEQLIVCRKWENSSKEIFVLMNVAYFCFLKNGKID